jgi:hypothetical protein
MAAIGSSQGPERWRVEELIDRLVDADNEWSTPL